jgi:predicted adenylyl cyclase CyaB
VIELELKAVVDDPGALLERLRSAGAREQFVGRMVDHRLDYANGWMTARDEVLRLRVYQSTNGVITAALDWKGPASVAGGYKKREEIDSSTGDPEAMMAILRNVGFRVTRSIEREIHQFDLAGAMVRLEHYEQMDDLVEVEGEPDAIERAIRVLAIPRSRFSADSLAQFVERFTARTGRPAVTGTVGEMPDVVR